jgi:hypothetical protein
MSIGRFRFLACSSGGYQPVYSVGGVWLRTNIDSKGAAVIYERLVALTGNYQRVKMLVLEACGRKFLPCVSRWLNSC